MTAKDGKPCKKCGTSEWDGRGNCKQCARNRAAKWYRNNLDAVKEYTKQNRESISDRTRKWREANSESVKEKSRQWREVNAESQKEKARQWKRNNKERHRAIQHTARRRYRARKRGAGGSHTTAEWEALVKYYEGRCLCCGRDDVKLTIDHIVPVSKGGSNNIDNIQPLCFSCNASKQAKIIDYRTKSGFGRWVQRKLFG